MALPAPGRCLLHSVPLVEKIRGLGLERKGLQAWGILFGVLGILCWLAPTMAADRPAGRPRCVVAIRRPWYRYLLGIDARPEGFDPSAVFAPGSWSWLTALALRFFRAVIVVAVVEELFWRGYLMRFLVNPDHPWKVPFGTHSWKAYWITTLCFMAVHQPVDYCGAFIYGSLAYLLAVWQKNLCAVIVMHAVANALLGLGRAGMGQMRTVVNPAFTERPILSTQAR